MLTTKSALVSETLSLQSLELLWRMPVCQRSCNENVRIRSCQEIDLFLGWNQWYFDCIQRVSLMRQGGEGRSRR
jgi:hypothetical protein